jgi:hypothetical protein
VRWQRCGLTFAELTTPADARMLAPLMAARQRLDVPGDSLADVRVGCLRRAHADAAQFYDLRWGEVDAALRHGARPPILHGLPYACSRGLGYLWRSAGSCASPQGWLSWLLLCTGTAALVHVRTGSGAAARCAAVAATAVAISAVAVAGPRAPAVFARFWPASALAMPCLAAAAAAPGVAIATYAPAALRRGVVGAAFALAAGGLFLLAWAPPPLLPVADWLYWWMGDAAFGGLQVGGAARDRFGRAAALTAVAALVLWAVSWRPGTAVHQ